MNLVDWIVERRPGSVEKNAEYIRISHDNGEYSTFWIQRNELSAWLSGDVLEFYRQYDGADLFSSTFKIAAFLERKRVGTMDLAFTLAEMQKSLDGYEFSLPKDSSAFMYQAGIGIYAAEHFSSKIYECDTETMEVTSYSSLHLIFQEWMDAVSEA
jgi:hypothetical protein